MAYTTYSGERMSKVLILGILAKLGGDLSQNRGPKNPFGRGRTYHGGQQITCQGTLQDDGSYADKHLMATFSGDVDGPVHALENDDESDETTLILAQPLDPANPVCTVCGKDPTI